MNEVEMNYSNNFQHFTNYKNMCFYQFETIYKIMIFPCFISRLTVFFFMRFTIFRLLCEFYGQTGYDQLRRAYHLKFVYTCLS